jgi:hypothetical protein
VSETLLHPYDGQAAPFDAFLPFIQLDVPYLREPFVNALAKLHEQTAELWQPGECLSTPSLQRTTEDLQAAGEIPDVSGSRIMNWHSGHFFLEWSLWDGTAQLTVDPSGTPLPGVNYYDQPRSILPFFGSAALAPQFHRQIYAASKPGYRRMVL